MIKLIVLLLNQSIVDWWENCYIPPPFMPSTMRASIIVNCDHTLMTHKKYSNADGQPVIVRGRDSDITYNGLIGWEYRLLTFN